MYSVFISNVCGRRDTVVNRIRPLTSLYRQAENLNDALPYSIFTLLNPEDPDSLEKGDSLLDNIEPPHLESLL